MGLSLGGSQKETQGITHGDLVKRKPRAGTKPNLPKPSNQDITLTRRLACSFSSSGFPPPKYDNNVDDIKTIIAAFI